MSKKTTDLLKEKVEFLPLLVGLPFEVRNNMIGTYIGNVNRRNAAPAYLDAPIEKKALIAFSNGTEDFNPIEIIPILYPLSAITDEHCIELAIIDDYDPTIIVKRPEAVINNIKSIFISGRKELLLSPHMWGWLMRHGYDVFGWIEGEVAKDRTKIKIPEWTKTIQFAQAS